MFPSIFSNWHIALTKQDKKQLVIEMLGIGFLALLFVMLFVQPSFANGGQLALEAVVTIVCKIARVVGVIFIIVGAVKFAISHANEQGAEQQKSIMMMATGIILVVIPTIILGISDKLFPVIDATDG